MPDSVLQVVPLPPSPTPWPTADPFLFCVHHHDAYPAGNERMGPVVSLAGRRIGQDFAAIDGWNMYHGSTVPGFPQHPHRGFETITFARQGFIDHHDSMGAAARFGRGDVQWMTAGGGVVHSEMFPLLRRDAPNPCELFQIWLNLPRADKLVEPYFTMLWAEDIPRHRVTDDRGRTAELTVLAGAFGDLTPPPPPPNSWAARPEADVAIWHVRCDPGAHITLPAATGADTARTVYVFEGNGLRIGNHEVGTRSAAMLDARNAVDCVAPGEEPVEALVLQGRSIGEPVAQYGPFVLNDRAGIEQAFADYQRDGFGGWPWPRPDPVNHRDRGRFALHADGRLEEAGSQPAR